MNGRIRNGKLPCPSSCQAAAPCSFTVGLGLREALRAFRDFGQGKLLMKTSGLTVLRRTDFSGFTEHSTSGDLLIEEVEFLRSNLELVVFRCPLLGCLRVAWLSMEGAVLAYLSFEEITWNSELVSSLRADLHCEARRHDEVCIRGCHRWLDDWTSEPYGLRKEFDRLGLISAMSACRTLCVTLKNCALDFSCSFRPGLIDVDADVLRISEAKRGTVVFADMGQSNFFFKGAKGYIAGPRWEERKGVFMKTFPSAT